MLLAPSTRKPNTDVAARVSFLDDLPCVAVACDYVLAQAVVTQDIDAWLRHCNPVL